MEVQGDLIRICDQLERQEPIFHRPNAASTLPDFERLMAPEYWEIGASGARYDRAFILQHLAEHTPVDATAAGWTTSNMACRQLSVDTFLLTYELDQTGRLTQRVTIWRWSGSDWQILYHQGTLIASGTPHLAS